jgi:hypothetical protein
MVFDSLASETFVSQFRNLRRPRTIFFWSLLISVTTKPPLAKGFTNFTSPIDFSIALATDMGLHCVSFKFLSDDCIMTLKSLEFGFLNWLKAFGLGLLLLHVYCLMGDSSTFD